MFDEYIVSKVLDTTAVKNIQFRIYSIYMYLCVHLYILDPTF
jgi:hypothetical protein